MSRRQTNEHADLARKVLALNLPGLVATDDDSYANRIGAGLPMTGAVGDELKKNGISYDQLQSAGFVRRGTNQLDYSALNRAVQEQFRGASTRGTSF